jgi:hypothetical protein
VEGSNPRQTWESGETLWELDYDNQPLTPQGFRNRNNKYLLDICLDDPTCREKLRHPKNNGLRQGGLP